MSQHEDREWPYQWAMRHSDAWHPGTRDECSHCQAMIEAFGEMPPIPVIRRMADAMVKGRGRKQKRRSIPTNVRAQVFARDGLMCSHCQSPDNLTIDHIVPVSKGGGDDLDNLQTLCRGCNSRKGART